MGEQAGNCQTKRTTWLWVTHGALLDSGPWWSARSKAPVPWCYPKAGRKRKDEAGGSLLGTSHQDWGGMKTVAAPVLGGPCSTAMQDC